MWYGYQYITSSGCRCPMYVHAHFQDATIYNKKVTREEALLFDPPSYVCVCFFFYVMKMIINMILYLKGAQSDCFRFFLHSEKSDQAPLIFTHHRWCVIVTLNDANRLINARGENWIKIANLPLMTRNYFPGLFSFLGFFSFFFSFIWTSIKMQTDSELLRNNNTAWVKKKLTEIDDVFKNKGMILKCSVKHNI